MLAIKRLVHKARRKVRHHGLRKTAYLALLKALGYPRWFSVLHAHYAEEVNAAFLQLPPRYAGGFLAPGELGESARDPEAGISEAFIRYALAKGDKCYGVIHDGALRSYGWYSSKPTRVSDELRLHFGREYVYMYKGFTHASHRGRRLFPSGVTRALRHYRSVGYKGMLLYVDAGNLASLKSCARMGFRVFGSVYIAKLLGRTFIYATPGCARFGLRVEDVSSESYRFGVRAATTRPATYASPSRRR